MGKWPWSPKKKKSSTPIHGPASPPDISGPSTKSPRPRKQSDRTLAHLNKLNKQSGNIITKSKFFRSIATRVFNDLDIDASQTLDVDELYTGVLLVHLQLAKFAGSAACKPPTRQQVQNLFIDFDDDNSSSLDVNEFLSMCVLLTGQVLGRVIFQWIFTLLISPMIGTFMLRVYHRWDYFLVNNISFIRKLYEMARIPIVNKFLEYLPATIPLALCSCIAASIIVPVVLNAIDEYFSRRAERRMAQKKNL